MKGEYNRMEESSVEGKCHGFMRYRCISWTAIIVGAFAAIGIGFLFVLLDIGIGLTAFSTKAGVTSVALGSLLWLVICSIVTMFIAGWISGRLAKTGTYKERDYRQCGGGVLHGFTTWCLALILVAIIGARAGELISVTLPLSAYNMQQNVRVISNEVSPAVTATPRNITVNAEKAANAVGVGMLGSFFIFFFGAIAGCVGGCVGYGSKDKYLAEEHQNELRNRL